MEAKTHSPTSTPTLTPWWKRKSFVIEAGLVIAIAVLLLVVIPPILIGMGQGFRVGLLGRFLALAIIALGIDLIWGFTGILSLGHDLFFALGGYSLAMYLQLQIPQGELVMH